jgi:signal transduction histidine kinase
MRFVVIAVMWKMLTRLLRRFGWGLLLVPVALLGMAVVGLSVWTIAAVALAVLVAFRLPAIAAALVPVLMVCLGLAGLVVAAASPGASAFWSGGSVSYAVREVPAPVAARLGGLPQPVQVRYTVSVPAGPGSVSVPAGPGSVSVKPASRNGGGPRTVVITRKGIIVMRKGPGQVAAGPVAEWVAGPQAAPAPPIPPAAIAKLGAVTVHAGPGKVVAFGARQVYIPGPGWWRGRLLVPVALLLLTLGLFLAPRTVAAVRARMGGQGLDPRAWLRENRWGVLLVPTTLIGLSIFGVRPWTMAAVVAAIIVVLRWPKIAADIVPLALALFAIRGFALATTWGSMAAGGPGPVMGPGLGSTYGPMLVDSRPAALLAGVEASAFLAFGAWLVPRTIGKHVRTLMSPDPDPDLAGRVQRLTETRGHAVDAAAAELRRIERDLHDGAQARLVALGMNLRAVERMLPTSPQAALALVAEARETSLRALNELRDLIRGICPPVLADRGLGHAVRALALDTPLPVELDIDLPGRLPAPVESACYFAVAEAIANAVKHSGARRVHIRIQHRSDVLRIEVADDGAGGADPDKGTGLRGVERRLGTFDGILAVSSPPGGPTMVVMEVPCALSSAKTYSS